jgi:hypothetical protein
LCKSSLCRSYSYRFDSSDPATFLAALFIKQLVKLCFAALIIANASVI